MTPTNHTPLDSFVLELHRATERHQAAPVAVALSPLHPVALGLPPSIYGMAAVYDRQLTPEQGFLFFDTQESFNRYASKITA
jgi:hypothetical protein